MSKTCDLAPERRVAGMGLATFLARRVGKVLMPAFLVGVVLSVPSSAQTKFSIVGKMPTTLPFELIDNRVFVEVLLDGRGNRYYTLVCLRCENCNGLKLQEIALIHLEVCHGYDFSRL